MLFRSGTATIYVDREDKFETPQRFHPTHFHLMELQTKFADYLKEKYMWIYSEPLVYSIKSEYPFGISVKQLLEMLQNTVMNREFKINEKRHYVNCVREMIMISWGYFYTNIASNLNSYKDRKKCFDEYYEYIKLLEYYVPPKELEFKEEAKRLVNTVKENVDWKAVTEFLGIKLLGMGCTAIFGPIVGQVVQLVSGAIIGGGFEIINQLKHGGQINWWQIGRAHV